MKDLQRQVERVVGTNCAKRSVNVAFEDNDYRNRFYDDNTQPSSSPSVPTFAYNTSRAEQTIQNEIKKKQRAADLPPGFQTTYFTNNGMQFPYHPSGKGKHSRFPRGFH